MTVTVTSYTTNSKKIAIASEITSDNIISNTHTEIQNIGWTAYDTTLNFVPGYGIRGSGCTLNTTVGAGSVSSVVVNNSGSGYVVGDILQIIDGSHVNGGSNVARYRVATVSGTSVATVTQISSGSGYSGNITGNATLCTGNYYSPMTQYVYRSATAQDANIYKYCIVRWNPLKTEFHVSSCESYSLTTYTPTNETWTAGGCFPHGYDLIDSYIWIGGSARNLTFWTFIKGEPGLWSMIMEFERIAPEDLAAEQYPNWAYTNSLMFGTPFAKTATNTTSTIMMAFPRTVENKTGAAAATGWGPATTRGMWPPAYPGATLTFTGLGTNQLHLADIYNATYGWDNTKKYVTPITINSTSKNTPFGRVYNVSATGNYGNAHDTTTLNLDSTGGWSSGSGTSSPAVFLPLNGGAEIDSAYTAAKIGSSYGQGTGVVINKAIAIGDNLWLACSDGVRQWAMSSANASAIGSALRSESLGVTDIVFDGKRTVYCATATGVVAIDTVTTATQTLIQGGTLSTDGAHRLELDEQNIYATSRVPSTAPKLFIITRSNNTYLATGTLSTTTLTNPSGFITPLPDYEGQVFVPTAQGNATNVLRIAKFSSVNGTQTLNVASPLTPGVTTQSGMRIDYTSGTLLFVGVSGTAYNMYTVNRLLSSFSTVTSLTGTSTTTSNGLNYLQYNTGTVTLATTGVITGTGTTFPATAATNGSIVIGVSAANSATPYSSTVTTYTSGTSITASSTGTVSATISSATWSTSSTQITINTVTGTLWAGTVLSHANLPAGVTISSQASGTVGGAGVYNLSQTTTAAGSAVAVTVTGVTYVLTYTPTDYLGDLAIFPWRGMLQIAFKNLGRASGSLIRAFNDPTNATPGTWTLNANSSATALSSIPGGYASNFTTNHVRVFAPLWVSATDNRVYYLNRFYQTVNFAGTACGRLLLKG